MSNKNKGWEEAPDQTGKAPEHVIASQKGKIKDVMRQPMAKTPDKDEDITEKKTNMLVEDEKEAEDEKDFEEKEDADDFKHLKNEGGTKELDLKSDEMDE